MTNLTDEELKALTLSRLEEEVKDQEKDVTKMWAEYRVSKEKCADCLLASYYGLHERYKEYTQRLAKKSTEHDAMK